jgi:hypothetical protein
MRTFFCYAVVETAELCSAVLQNKMCVNVSECWCRPKIVMERADKRIPSFQFNEITVDAALK